MPERQRAESRRAPPVTKKSSVTVGADKRLDELLTKIVELAAAPPAPVVLDASIYVFHTHDLSDRVFKVLERSCAPPP